MLASTLFIRVVPQYGDRGYNLLAGYDAAVVQRTAIQIITLAAPTRASLTRAIEKLKSDNSAAEVRDVTASNIQKKLAREFGEVTAPAATPAATPAGTMTFAALGVSKYLDSPF